MTNLSSIFNTSSIVKDYFQTVYMESELMSNLKLTNLKSFAKSSGHEGYPQLEEKDPMNLNLSNSTFYVDVTKKKYI